MKKLFLVFSLLFLAQVANAAQYDIAVLRDRRSPMLNQVFYAFAAVADKTFINFDLKPGNELTVAKSLRLESVRAVLLLGDPTPELLTNIDPKLPILIVRRGQNELMSLPERTGMVQLSADLGVEQTIDMIAELFPNKKRLGVAYNPKFTMNLVNDLARLGRLKEFSLVPLKIDQPADLAALAPTFKDHIDLFLMIKDATVIQAGLANSIGFFRDQRIPVIAPSEALSGEGATITMHVDSFSLGRNAWAIIAKMLAGQTAFKTDFEKHDIHVDISLKEALRIRSQAVEILDLMQKAVNAGYRVEVD